MGGGGSLGRTGRCPPSPRLRRTLLRLTRYKFVKADQAPENSYKFTHGPIITEIIRTPTKAGRLVSLNRPGGRRSASQIDGLSTTRRAPSASVPRCPLLPVLSKHGPTR